MGVVFDEVVAQVEPEPTARGADGQGASPAAGDPAAREATLGAVRAHLSLLAHRAARLRAD